MQTGVYLQEHVAAIFWDSGLGNTRNKQQGCHCEESRRNEVKADDAAIQSNKDTQASPA